MLEILLIRHGATDWNQMRRIMGRKPIPLNAEGRRQAVALRRALRSVPLAAIYTSPVRRAVETAQFIARGRNVKLIKTDAVAEIDYGRWVGKYFDEVTGDPAYRTYHTTPARAQAPGGEKVAVVYRRAIRFIKGLGKRHLGRVAVVSHADVIKLILIHTLQLEINDLPKIRIDNGSVSSITMEQGHARVLAINAPSELRRLFIRTDQLLPLPKKK